MNSRLFLLPMAAILFAACDRQAAVREQQRVAELAEQHQKEQVANDKIRALETRIGEAERMKAAEREAELARVKDELAQLKQDREQAAGRIRELETKGSQPAPVAEAPHGTAVQADVERVIEEEDREPVYVGRVVPETQRVTSVQSFYEPLDSYGDWIETDDYGYVFRPQVAVTVTSWRPYTDGRWIHSDYGWTWESNEDFGWATYHYGRWARVSGTGWVWVPGRDWGPGWVSWRRGNDYCGWAPLPPESRTRFSFTASVDRDYDLGPAAYIFISLANFGARSYVPVCAPPERNLTIIQKTVNITNINYNTVNNQTVVYNGGPSYNLVRARSQQPVEQVNVNFAPVNKTVNNTTINKTKIVNIRQGNTLQVAAPPPIAATAPAVPPRVKAKIGKPKVEKGWEGIDSAQVQKVRQEIAQSSVERKKKPHPVAAAPSLPEPKAGSDATAVPTKPETPSAAPVRPIRATPNPAEPAKGIVEAPKTATPPVAPARPESIAPRTEPEVPKSKPTERPKAITPEPEKAKPFTDPPLPRPDKPERPKVVPPTGTPANQSDEKPERAKPPKANRPNADKPATPEAARPPKLERPAPPRAPETPAANRPQTPVAPQPGHELPKVPKVKRVPAEGEPQAIRQPAPNPSRPIGAENGERNRERVVRQAPPVVTPPAHPQQPPAQPQGAGVDAEKKKKKKDKENGQ